MIVAVAVAVTPVGTVPDGDAVAVAVDKGVGVEVTVAVGGGVSVEVAVTEGEDVAVEVRTSVGVWVGGIVTVGIGASCSKFLAINARKVCTSVVGEIGVEPPRDITLGLGNSARREKTRIPISSKVSKIVWLFASCTILLPLVNLCILTPSSTS